MYEDHYGFKEKPFSLLPDPAFLFMTKGHSLALSLLEYSLINESAGICVITGEIGSGKTTLLRKLLDSMAPHFNIGMLTNTHCEFGNLIQWVSMTFGLEYKNKKPVELYDDFVNYTINEYAKKNRTVLIIDEAQNLTRNALEELRMLSNINSDKNQILQLILIGQPELRKTFNNQQLEQLSQRVSVSYHLSTLNQHESCAYIKHRILTAGGDPLIFSESACKAIWFYSKGTPRIINTLCDTALVYAFSDKRKKVDIRLVSEVIKDRRNNDFHTRESNNSNNVTQLNGSLNKAFNI